MKHWCVSIVFLFFTILCHGEQKEVLGLTFAGDPIKAATEVKGHYATENNGSILKIYAGTDSKGNAKWEDIADDKLKDYANSPTYIISHGLNANYYDSFISESAEAIKASNPNAIILSVNWDYYSGNNDNKNFMASTWINPVSTVLAEKLSVLNNIKSFVGHSYGAHLLASTMAKMSNSGNLNESQISFVALDPAEESLTFTGEKRPNPNDYAKGTADEQYKNDIDKYNNALKKYEPKPEDYKNGKEDSDYLLAMEYYQKLLDGNFTWLWEDDKKSKDWNLPANVTSEVYKSSGLLGSEERLGDYNYFLAQEGSITPKAVGGDLKTGLWGENNFISNHSLACQWFASMMKCQSAQSLSDNAGKDDKDKTITMGGYSDTSLIGGWYNSTIDSNSSVDHSKKTRQSDDKGWDATINATKALDIANKLTLTTDNKIVDDRKTDRITLQAGSFEKIKNQSIEFIAKDGQYKSWQDLCNAEAQALIDKKLNGIADTWGYIFSSDKGESNWEGTILNPSAYFWYKIFHGDAKAGETAIDQTGNIAIRSDNDTVIYYDTKENKYYSYSLKDGEFTKFEGSQEDVLKQIEQKMNPESSETSDSSITAGVDGYVDSHASDIDQTVSDVDISKNQSTSIMDKAVDAAKKLIARYVTLENVKKVAQKGLDLLFQKFPALQSIMNRLGIKDINDIISIGKEIYTLVKDWLNGGDFIQLLANCTKLKEILKAGLGELVNILQDIIHNMTTQFISELAQFVSNLLNGLLSKLTSFQITPTQIENLINSAIDKALDKGTEWVTSRVDSYLSTDSSGNKNNDAGNSSSQGNDSTRTSKSAFQGMQIINAE